MTTKCPICRSKVKIFRDNEPGDEIYCEDCDRELTIISMDPTVVEVTEDFGTDYYFDETDY